MVICNICSKSFSTSAALNGHTRKHGPSLGKIHTPRCCCLITKRELPAKYLEKFQTAIKYCKHCNLPLSTKRKFCNSSCAASYNNNQRIKDGYVITDEHKIKVSQTLKTFYKTTPPIKFHKSNPTNKKKYNKKCLPRTNTQRETENKQNRLKYLKKIKTFETTKHASGPFSKIYFRCCQHCFTTFMCRKKLKYCTVCAPLYTTNYRNRFKFLFNVYHYPDLFDIPTIQTIGWYSRGGKAGEWNPDGLSRDHKVSVTEAIKNNYEPYYITHPMNCEIMPWLVNNKKKGKSSIDYDTLKYLVNQYDSKKS